MIKKTKIIVFNVILIILIGIFIFLKYRSYDYSVNYVIDKYKIKEIYNKQENSYTFYITDSEVTYPYKIYNKYLRAKEIIEKVDTYPNDNEVCILPKSDKLIFYPLCYNNENIYKYNLSNNEIKDYKYEKITKSNIKHDKLDINYLYNNNFLLYNYKGFYYINDKGIKEINLFNKDIYTIELVYQFNEYLIVADYNNEYYFKKLFIININTGKLDEITTDKEISFSSIFLGHYKNNLYLLDKKEEKEYKINIKKKEVEEIEYVILKDNKLIETTYKEIINKNLLFDNIPQNYYKIIDNKLYQTIDDNRILVSNKDINKIIKEDKDTVYYLSNEELYMYNDRYGEVLLISNFEWNFNNTNMVYLN